MTARSRIQPLVRRGGRVVVDGRPICADCGRPVRPTGPDRWRHVRPGQTPGRPSRWLSPRLRDLRRCVDYDDLVRTYPWAARAGATEADRREAIRRLEAYEAALGPLGRGRRRVVDGSNPYLDLMRLLTADLTPGLTALLSLSERRRELVDVFAWATPTAAALDVLASFGPLVECGAGAGYWAALLRARGVDVVPTDLDPPRRSWTKVVRLSAVEAARRHPDRTLLLCWPPFDDDAASYDAVRAYRGDVLVHVGEQSGASGSVRFHRELASRWAVVHELELPSWPWLEERLTVYRRSLARRAHVARDRCPECGRFVSPGSIGRCDRCFRERPPALALRAGRHRVEYSAELLAAMPEALRKALEASPNRIH